MVESSDLQAAILRTQAMERIQQLQSQQEELNRKRFELEAARERDAKGKKVQDPQKAEHKRVVRDRYEGEREHPREDAPETPADPKDDDDDGSPPRRDGEAGRGGAFDVRI